MSNRLIEFQDMNLCLGGCPEWLSLILPSGYVDFDTEFEWAFAKRLSLTDPVDTFKVVVRGALAYDVEARAVATQEFAADTVATLLTVPVPIPMPPVL